MPDVIFNGLNLIGRLHRSVHCHQTRLSHNQRSGASCMVHNCSWGPLKINPKGPQNQMPLLLPVPAEWSKPLDDPFFFNRKVLKLVGSWLKDWHDRWGPDLINKVGRPRSSKPLVTSPRWVGPMHATISLSCYLSKDSSRLLVLAKRNLSPPKQPQNHGTVPIEVCTITFPTNIIQSHSWHRHHRRATVGKSDSPIKRQV